MEKTKCQNISFLNQGKTDESSVPTTEVPTTEVLTSYLPIPQVPITPVDIIKEPSGHQMTLPKPTPSTLSPMPNLM